MLYEGMEKDHPMRILATLLCCAALGAAPALAQSAAPSVDELIEGLVPESGLRRGIRVPSAPPPATAPQPASQLPVAHPPVAQRPAPEPMVTQTTAPPGVAAVALTVTFATASAELAPSAEAVLNNLGRALASPQLAGFRFRVEGHTDTVGARGLNQVLSERRASAVRDWLVRRHGIDPRRLEAVGLGEQQPLVATPDETPEPRNRRVQVINLGG